MKEESQPVFSDVVREALVSAGWFPGRRVTARLKVWEEQLVRHGEFEMFPAARAALLEYGTGLTRLTNNSDSEGYPAWRPGERR